MGCPLLSGMSEKLSQILGKGIRLKTKNCIKVSKSLGNGECYSEKQVISSALALTVIAGDLEHLEQRQRKRKNKNSIPSRI